MKLEFIDEEIEEYFEDSEETEDDTNIYNTKNREEALEDDEIADWEEAVMLGYDEAYLDSVDDAVV